MKRFLQLVLSIYVVLSSAMLGTASLAESLFRDAEVMDFQTGATTMQNYGIDPTEKLRYCCRYHIEGNRTAGDLVPFDAEDGWFLFVRIDRRELVRLDMHMSCHGFLGGERECDAEEVEEEFQSRITTYTGFPGWYGKYHNKFHAFSGGEEISWTDLLTGQDLTLLERTEGTDTILIGPLVVRPERVELHFNRGPSSVVYSEMG